MSSTRPVVIGSTFIGLAGLVHASLTWPAAATVTFFGIGTLAALTAEAVVVSLGWLRHHAGPAIRGVPVYVLFGWTGTIYVAFRLALSVTDGLSAVFLAAILATAADLLTDHLGVANGYWTYTDVGPGPRIRDVPWWNFAGWFTITALTAGGTLVVL